jgi:hypothetical protein
MKSPLLAACILLTLNVLLPAQENPSEGNADENMKALFQQQMKSTTEPAQKEALRNEQKAWRHDHFGS